MVKKRRKTHAKSSQIPLGMKLILILSIFGLLSVIPALTKSNPLEYAIFFGYQMSASFYTIKLLLISVVSLLTIIAIVKRYKWGWSFYIITAIIYLLDSALEYSHVLNQTTQKNSESIFTYALVFFFLGILPTYYIYKNKTWFNKK